MKILIATPLYPPEIGGPATYTALLEREFSLRGFQVAVAKLSDVKKWPFGIKHLFYFFKLLRAGAEADIVFAQDPLGVGLPALCAAKILGKKFVVKIVGDRAWEEYVNLKSQISNLKSDTANKKYDLLDEFQGKKYSLGIEMRRCIQKYVARHADKIVVPSGYLKKIIVNGWGVTPEKVEVIYNAFELPKLNITHEEARARLLLSASARAEGQDGLGEILVSIGRLVPWKGFGALIEMFPNIVKKYPQAKLYIIGDGPERKNLKSQISNLKLGNSVFLIGQLSHDDTMLYLTAADVFVLNTGYEGLSHTILEAMALGVPVVTTRVGGNPELIEDGVSGRLVTYQDKKALAEAITEILADVTKARQRFEKSARGKAAKFSKERMLEHLTQLFKQI
ncbi:MAG: glycosyltransferase family 4 protein [Candidatus Lloydbacteria bacterium]|nr:glycosyltransferase family 4 protein [Candidatus Lloydbacteria bacterium]